MKKLVIAITALVIMAVGSGNAFAAQKSGMQIDGSLSFATDIYTGYGATFGLGVGMSADISDRMHLSDKRAKLQLRGDINYYSSDETLMGMSLSAKRMPVFVGGRYFIPMQSKSNMDLYVEGGVEVSFDKIESGIPFFGKISVSETNIGVAPGVGIEFPLGDNLVLGLNARYHLVSGSYLTGAASIGVKF
jgi:opacity protein-like surface antigen